MAIYGLGWIGGIYGQERVGGEWWDLFCSEACARSWHPDMQDVEWFANLSVLESRLGWPEGEMEKHTLKCSGCGTPLPGVAIRAGSEKWITIEEDAATWLAERGLPPVKAASLLRIATERQS